MYGGELVTEQSIAQMDEIVNGHVLGYEDALGGDILRRQRSWSGPSR